MAGVTSLALLARMQRAFWDLTVSGSDEHRALRALTLHMFEQHAPTVFAELALAPLRDEALADIATLATDLAVPFESAIARVDAWFVRRERNIAGAELDVAELEALLWRLDEADQSLQAFILQETAALSGVTANGPLGDQFRCWDSIDEVYRLTHVGLHASRFLARRLTPSDPAMHAALLSLREASHWVVASGHLDLAAEIALCLQAADAHDAPEYAALVTMVAGRVADDGVALDAAAGPRAREVADHATAAAWLALAGNHEVSRAAAQGSTESTREDSQGGPNTGDNAQP